MTTSLHANRYPLPPPTTRTTTTTKNKKQTTTRTKYKQQYTQQTPRTIVKSIRLFHKFLIVIGMKLDANSPAYGLRYTHTRKRESGSESEKQREIERDPNRYARYRHVIEILEYLITVWTHAPHQPSTTLTSILLATKWPKDTEVPPPLPPFLTLSQSPKDS